MAKLFAEYYDHSGRAYPLISGANTEDTELEALKPRVQQAYRDSNHYVLNDAMYFDQDQVSVSPHRARLPLGSDRYILYWIQ
jgi:hypothetical protein